MPRRHTIPCRPLDRYGAGIDLMLEAPDAVVARTEGVGASFVMELLRRAALLAAQGADELVVTDRHVSPSTSSSSPAAYSTCASLAASLPRSQTGTRDRSAGMVRREPPGTP